MKGKFNIFLVSFLLITFSAFSQIEETPSDNSLNSQFSELLDKSETYDDYKVIKRTRLNDFWAIVNDSLNMMNKNISELSATISTQQEEISSINIQLEELKAESEEALFDSTHISFIGIDFEKSTFKITMLVIIGLLGIFIGVGYARFNQNKKEASKKVLSFDALEIEFEEYKKKSFDKQIKLKRELQTERNRNEDLMNKGNKSSKVSV